MSYFSGKVVIVTGAGSGIGRASALAFGAAGAAVHLVDIRSDRLADALAECKAAGQLASSHVVNCVEPEEMEALAAEIYDRRGRVDVLQNGVGALVAAPVEALTLDSWRRSIDLNLWTVINGIQAFVPRMLNQDGRAHVVNVASVAGLIGFPYTAPYSTMKFAIVGLSEALSAELHERGITVTVVCPGMVRSNLVSDGHLKLPDSWTRVVERAYESFAASPEWLAEQILEAVKRRRGLVVPSLGLSQLWRLKRWAGAWYPGMARELTSGAIRLGRAGKKIIG